MGTSLVVYLPGSLGGGGWSPSLPGGWCFAAAPQEGAKGTVHTPDPERVREQVEGLASLLHHGGADGGVVARLAGCGRVVGLSVNPANEAHLWPGARWIAAREGGFIFDGRRLTDASGFQLHPSPPPWPGLRGRLAQRACACMAVACRGMLDPGDRARGEPVRERLIAWIGEHGLLEALTTDEVALVCSPIGSAAPEVLAGAAWRVEWVHVLLWALGIGELFPPDRQEHPEVLGRVVGLMARTLPPAIRGESTGVRRDVAAAVPCLRWMELALREGGGIPLVWELPAGPGSPAQDPQGRVLVQGHPITELEDGLRTTVYSVVSERLACLRWVMRQGEP